MMLKTFKKPLFQIFVLIILSTPLFANTIEEAKKMLNYERYNNAESILKTIISTPEVKDKILEEAYYLLGQTYLFNIRVADARQSYQTAMQKMPSSSLIMVGMGEVLLNEKKENEAYALFDNALLQTKFKDVKVLTALARAYSKIRNLSYEYPLKQFGQIHEKAKKDAEFYVALGDFYRRKRDGNNAYANYQLALIQDANYAPAKYRLGKIFLSQNNKEIFLQNCLDVIMLDKNYAPAYYDLYAYYYHSEVNRAKEYFDKYKAVTDPNVSLEFEEASLLYAVKQDKEALTKALALIDKYKENVDVRAYRLAGYASNRLGDSVNAKIYLETFFAKNKNEDVIQLDNYKTYARVLRKFPETKELAFTYYQKAFNEDTVLSTKLDIIKDIIIAYKADKNYGQLSNWYKISYSIKPTPSKSDLFSWGQYSSFAKQYDVADSVFNLYSQKYPEEYYGYFWRAKIKADTDTTFASALPFYQKTIDLLKQDSIKNKSVLIQCYQGIISYEMFTAGAHSEDKEYSKVPHYTNALSYIDKILGIDPNNQDMKAERESLAKNLEAVIKYETQLAEYNKKNKKKTEAVKTEETATTPANK